MSNEILHLFLLILTLSFIFCSVFEAGKPLWRSYRRSTLRLMCCFMEPTPSDRNWTVREHTHTHTHLTTPRAESEWVLWMSVLLYFSLCDIWSLRWPSQLLACEALLQLSTLFMLLQPDPPYSMFPKRCNWFHFFFWPVVVPSPSQTPLRSPLSAHSLLSSVMALIWVCPWAVRQGRHLSANNNHTCSFPWLQLRPPRAAIKHMLKRHALLHTHAHTHAHACIFHTRQVQRQLLSFHLSYLINRLLMLVATMCCFISKADLKNRAILINRCFASLRNVGLLHACLCTNN